MCPLPLINCFLASNVHLLIDWNHSSSKISFMEALFVGSTSKIRDIIGLEACGNNLNSLYGPCKGFLGPDFATGLAVDADADGVCSFDP